MDETTVFTLQMFSPALFKQLYFLDEFTPIFNENIFCVRDFCTFIGDKTVIFFQVDISRSNWKYWNVKKMKIYRQTIAITESKRSLDT